MQLPALTTIGLIYEHHENAASLEQVRPHLGASLIGEPCLRKLWYGFRWVKKIKHDGRLLRLFETGNLFEERIIKELRAIGIEISESVNGEQHKVSHLGGHISGSLDGAGKGFIEAPKTWHVLEFKTHGEKSFKELLEKKVENAKPLHFAQMQVYMGLTGMTRAAYIAVNKNTDELYFERIEFNQKVFDSLVEKADKVIFSQHPLMKINESPAWWYCRFCDYKDVCHEKKIPEVNCRTCLHSTPMRDGTWVCEKFNKELSVEEQAKGCGSHLYIPDFIGKPIDSGDNYVEYENGLKNLAGGAII